MAQHHPLVLLSTPFVCFGGLIGANWTPDAALGLQTLIAHLEPSENKTYNTFYHAFLPKLVPSQIYSGALLGRGYFHR